MFKLKFETDNAAFDGDDWDKEIARILKYIAEIVEEGRTYGPVFDSNSNDIGEWEATR